MGNWKPGIQKCKIGHSGDPTTKLTSGRTSDPIFGVMSPLAGAFLASQIEENLRSEKPRIDAINIPPIKYPSWSKIDAIDISTT